MYNHYIPQSDGSYRRNPQPEHRRSAPPPKPKPEPPCPPPKPPEQPEQPKPTPPPPCPAPQGSILNFLRGLLPRSIDTADLLIIALLLLMNQEDEKGLSPVLTLALYFLL